jgi:hypothetical protein
VTHTRLLLTLADSGRPAPDAHRCCPVHIPSPSMRTDLLAGSGRLLAYAVVKVYRLFRKYSLLVFDTSALPYQGLKNLVYLFDFAFRPACTCNTGLRQVPQCVTPHAWSIILWQTSPRATIMSIAVCLAWYLPVTQAGKHALRIHVRTTARSYDECLEAGADLGGPNDMWQTVGAATAHGQDSSRKQHR